VAQEPAEGGVRLRFTVREKWYVLPVPIVQGNSGGQFGYGGQLRWYDIAGLNQTLNLEIVKSKYNEPDRSGQINYQSSYTAPLLGGSRFGLTGALGHTSQDSIDPAGQPYGEVLDNASLLGNYALSPGPPSRGWNVGGGLTWLRDATSGPYAPPSPGDATALTGAVVYNRLRELVYSEEGRSFGLNMQIAREGIASAYNFSNLSANYREDWPVGHTQYQEAELRAAVGAYFGGAPGRVHNAYTLGGTRQLLGYSSESVEGDYSHYLAGTFLRPVGWNWLRAMAIVEAGSAYVQPKHFGDRPTYASVGIGVRIRISWLVNVELQAGIAYPLVDGNRPRLFAGSV
jgi:hypothetical protein